MAKSLDRFRNAFRAFTKPRDAPANILYSVSDYSYVRPDKPYRDIRNDKTILNSMINRMAIDCAAIKIEHVKVDDGGRYLETINSNLNNCFSCEANLDENASAFLIDLYTSLFNEGVIAIVPTVTDTNIKNTDDYDVCEMRIGKILQWMPQHVKVEVYNEWTMRKEPIIFPKKDVCIIENPFYAVMNDPNSTLKRLRRKIILLDAIDEQIGSNKLDLLIQLPYTTNSEIKKKQAEDRLKKIEMQLVGSKYGIAYIDATEKVTQLNRPIENNLLAQIDSLTRKLYSEIGFSEHIVDGTADEKEQLNYYNHIIEPVLKTVCLEFKRKFLSEDKRNKEHESIAYFNDPFKLITSDKMADIADKYTRNEILSSNELRQAIGAKPVADAAADELRNKNLNPTEDMDYATTKEKSINTITKNINPEEDNKDG